MVDKKNTEPENTPGSLPEKLQGNLPEEIPDGGSGGRTRIALVVIALLILGCAAVFGSGLLNASPPSVPEASGPATVFYFYGAECPHCHEVTPYVESLREKYPDVNFRILETWHNETNNALFLLLNHKLGRTTSGVPEAVIGNLSLLGEDEIRAKLEPAILAQRNLTGSKVVGAIPVTGSAAGTNATITALFFYGNGCSHCEAVEPLVDAVGSKYPDLRIERLEINDNITNKAVFLETMRLYGLSNGRIPAIFIGDSALVGEDEVKNRFEERVLSEHQRIAAGDRTIPVNAVYFYSDTCSHCENLKPYIANVTARYPALNLSRLEINGNARNREQLIDMSSLHGIQNPGVPALFIGNTVLVGEGDITTRLEPAILAEQERIASSGPVNPVNLTPGPGTPPAVDGLSLYMVVFAALIDSTNPCGLSVLVFLLISMAAAGGRKRILLVGGVYIFAMFLFHLFVGVGLFSAMALSGLAKPFSIIGGAIALVLGIVTLVDVLRNRETYLLSIPESGKGLLGTYIRQATLPAAFILGVLAGILGFTCTGGIYVSILGLMSREMNVMAGLPYLILYNLIFVLPLVLVTLLVAYGLSPERADRWRNEHKRAIRVIIGVILVILGLVILGGWFR